ncbi:phosphoenolpyruvate protein kinase [Vibrio coralliilyticus]|uniref:Phosphoenolpyruvate protein kinase n=3 Tax=Vibrio TaxID=662 RepID=A0AAN0SDV9_9VIBR|nr:phosphoenolpyruvate protein kinase [Vibrio coralliilyticus]AIW19436.1 phosphoenolpyruvate protein kinase [Vibrio coralliilyticus]
MQMYLAQFFKTAGEPAILKRSLKVSLIVGTILMFINHGDKLLSSNIDATLVIKILMTYCVPFCVSTQASVSATLQSRNKAA